MLALHGSRTLIVAIIAGNVALALWAFLAHLRGRRSMGQGFWTVLLIVVAVMGLPVAAGIFLALAGAHPRSGLHYLYAAVIVALAIYVVGLRPGGFVRGQHAFWLGRDPHSPTGLALLCFIQAALILRAYTTGAFGR